MRIVLFCCSLLNWLAVNKMIWLRYKLLRVVIFENAWKYSCHILKVWEFKTEHWQIYQFHFVIESLVNDQKKSSLSFHFNVHHQQIKFRILLLTIKCSHAPEGSPHVLTCVKMTPNAKQTDVAPTRNSAALVSLSLS